MFLSWRLFKQIPQTAAQSALPELRSDIPPPYAQAYGPTWVGEYEQQQPDSRGVTKKNNANEFGSGFSQTSTRGRSVTSHASESDMPPRRRPNRRHTFHPSTTFREERERINLSRERRKVARPKSHRSPSADQDEDLEPEPISLGISAKTEAAKSYIAKLQPKSATGPNMDSKAERAAHPIFPEYPARDLDLQWRLNHSEENLSTRPNRGSSPDSSVEKDGNEEDSVKQSTKYQSPFVVSLFSKCKHVSY